MRKIAPIIILTLLSLISSAQRSNERINLMTVTYTGDSTLLAERYEINILKKKIYSITPIVNYRDIKGVKYRTRKKINRKKWKEIVILINKIDFTKLVELEKENLIKAKNQTDKQIYSIEIETSENETKNYKIINNDKTNELDNLFKAIREIK